jgi:hypothetical protein
VPRGRLFKRRLDTKKFGIEVDRTVQVVCYTQALTPTHTHMHKHQPRIICLHGNKVADHKIAVLRHLLTAQCHLRSCVISTGIVNMAVP